MDIVTRLRLSLLVLASLISLITIFYCAIKGKKTPILRSFILYIVLFVIWFVGQILRIFSPSREIEWIWVRLEYFGICFIGLAWLVFCLLYTENRWIKRPMVRIGLSIIPAASYISVLTNDWHHQFFKASDQAFDTFNGVFYLHTIESYLYIALGTFILIQYSFYQHAYKRKQVALLVLAAILPLFVNMLIITNLLTIEFDTTPLCLVISLIFYFVATFKYKMLDMAPIAQRKIVDTMDEAICVIDRFDRIIDYNRAFTATFPEIAAIKEPDFNAFAEVLLERAGKNFKTQQLITDIRENPTGQLNSEIKLTTPRVCWLVLKMQPLYNRQELLGKVISFNDISEYRYLVEELHRKNDELMAVNEQLREYAATIGELAVVKERNRFAKDVHDTLGQTMTLLVTLLQFSSMYCRSNPELAEQKLEEAKKIAEDGLAEVRRSLTGITAVEFNSRSLLYVLQDLISGYENTGMRCYLTVEGLQGDAEINLADTIYRICQEALTNSMRHGKAKSVYLRITFNDDCIDILIKDDGCGCNEIAIGYGLSGMQSRVRALNGEITFSKHDGEGFEIHARLPASSPQRFS